MEFKVAMLSYSTKGSGSGETVVMMINATKKVKEKCPNMAIDGELQFDAAVSPVVAETKYKSSDVAGKANTHHRRAARQWTAPIAGSCA